MFAPSQQTLADEATTGEKFVFMTNWFPEAEHGGFYHALASGQYKKYGLDVTIKTGGPSVNVIQLMAAGQADCVMGGSDLQMIEVRQSGVPVVNVAAIFQKDPQVIITHEDVTNLNQLKTKTLLIVPFARQGFWPWMKTTFGLVDEQTKPYTFNVQPFIADKNIAQQGYLTSEPYSIQKAGGRANVFLLSDLGYSAYSTTITCLEKTLKTKKQAVASFVKASVEGWKSYLNNPSIANALIKKENPEMTDDQLAYSVQKLKEKNIITGGDAPKLGIGIITDQRAKANFDMMVNYKIIDPSKVKVTDTYTTEFVKDLKVLP
jgi:NitT/TauT family transport system substrate-binding protein